MKENVSFFCRHFSDILRWTRNSNENMHRASVCLAGDEMYKRSQKMNEWQREQQVKKSFFGIQ
jgi:hypothetical protein